MHQVTNYGRRRLEIELRRAEGARRFEVIEPGQTRTLDIDPTDPTLVAQQAANLISISAVAQPALTKQPMPRRLGVRLARPPAATVPDTSPEKENHDA